MPLKIEVEYDHVSGGFTARLENGASFTFTRSDISGKLENNLDLYRRAVIRLLEGEPLPTSSKKDSRREVIELSAGKHVNVVGVKKKLTKLNLDDLEIDL